MIGWPHLLFGAVLIAAALSFWRTQAYWVDTPLVMSQAVVLGLIVGGALCLVI